MFIFERDESEQNYVSVWKWEVPSTAGALSTLQTCSKVSLYEFLCHSVNHREEKYKQEYENHGLLIKENSY